MLEIELSKNLSERLRAVYLDGTWVANTNYQKILSDVNLEDSLIKIGNLNTIAKLTFHINYYLNGLLEAFESGSLEIRDKYSFDLPAIESEEDWKKLVNSLLSNATKFIEYVESLPNEKLLSPFIEPKYGTFLRNVEGVIDHSYYHLGQISLIKKRIEEYPISNVE